MKYYGIVQDDMEQSYIISVNAKTDAEAYRMVEKEYYDIVAEQLVRPEIDSMVVLTMDQFDFMCKNAPYYSGEYTVLG